jgi:hypothetical protein
MGKVAASATFLSTFRTNSFAADTFDVPAITAAFSTSAGNQEHSCVAAKKSRFQ